MLRHWGGEKRDSWRYRNGKKECEERERKEKYSPNKQRVVEGKGNKGYVLLETQEAGEDLVSGSYGRCTQTVFTTGEMTSNFGRCPDTTAKGSRLAYSRGQHKLQSHITRCVSHG